MNKGLKDLLCDQCCKSFTQKYLNLLRDLWQTIGKSVVKTVPAIMSSLNTSPMKIKSLPLTYA